MLVVNIVLIVLVAAVFGYLYYKQQKEIKMLEEALIEVRGKVNDLFVENMMFKPDSETDLFEEKVEDLADRLFQMLQKKHGVDVTTYSEMIKELKNTEVGDKELKDEVIDFFDSIIMMKYSEGELDSGERKKIKEEAVDLIKRTGQTIDVEDSS